MKSVVLQEIIRIEEDSVFRMSDAVAAEEPLEIKIEYGDEDHRQLKNISITMRTPGSDRELSTGFLLTEGIIHHKKEILEISTDAIDENKITVKLSPEATFDLTKLDRHFYTSSSCGVCGKSSINSVKTVLPNYDFSQESWMIAPDLIQSLPEKLRSAQKIFESTGGLHASALFNKSGDLLMLKEDVGRHNALDKLIGAALENELLPLDQHLLLLSGRISFELVQKAAMAGVRVILAIGAPSGLAIQLAEEAGITLCGFIKADRLNLYTVPARVNFAKQSENYESKN
ncbi:formate dehydrogenase accessory sulfurtransferase FdhD [soil metagenome]